MLKLWLEPQLTIAVIVSKANKGNSTIILTYSDNVNKTLDLIYKNGHAQLKNDPRTRFKQQIKIAITAVTFITPNNEAHKSVSINSTAPNLRAHPEVPSRPNKLIQQLARIIINKIINIPQEMPNILGKIMIESELKNF